MATLSELQDRARRLHLQQSAPPTSTTPRVPFSPFHPDRLAEMQRLLSLAQSIVGATASDEDGLDRALAMFEAAVPIYGLNLVKYALLLFSTHEARGRLLPLPTYFERHPELMGQFTGVVAASSDGDEAKLDRWREDPFFNEHHEHWHIVYSSSTQKDRHGELFFYMHQQMLARYETERECRSAAPLTPLVDYVNPIPEGYRPDTVAPQDATFVSRPANQPWQGHPQIGLPSNLIAGKAAFEKAVQDMELTSPAGPTYDLSASTQTEYIERVNVLGGTIEPNYLRYRDQFGDATYGGLHGEGHMVISFSPYLFTNQLHLGAMSAPWTSAMDPVFWRWHKMIDNVAFEYQEKLNLLDFTGLPSDITVKDIIVCTGEQVGVHYADADQQDAIRTWAEATFGGANWDSEFASGNDSVDTLRTYETVGQFDPDDLAAPQQNVTYLDHEDFAYVVRIHNTRSENRTVTVRLWLCEETEVENRRRWIEMDTFEAKLPASAKAVVYRSSRQSSVVKKKDGFARVPPVLQTPAGVPDQDWDAGSDYCDCGWPHSLLLPRGTDTGRAFRLLAVVTDGDIDMQGETHDCGSVSMCGTRSTNYPDKKPMGWPFCFKWPAAGIVTTLDGLAQAASRSLTIKYG